MGRAPRGGGPDRWARRLAPLATLGIAACGGAGGTASTSCRAPATPAQPSPRAAVGSVSLVAGAATVPAGQTLDLHAEVAGPVRLGAPCSGPAEIVVTDHGGAHVFAATPVAAAGERCGDLVLAAGEHAAYDRRWTPDSTLPSGTYTVTVSVGDQAPVSVSVGLGRRPEEPCR